MSAAPRIRARAGFPRNLLTRFGHSAYLFFMITPPELLVKRA
jgi:hypothetical protein